VAELTACQWNNEQAGHTLDVYGIVSNGQVWHLYKLTTDKRFPETDPYAIRVLPDLLGALDYVCARCQENVERFLMPLTPMITTS
jgi:hypothetical protein